jgi:hypothetical protein
MGSARNYLSRHRRLNGRGQISPSSNHSCCSATVSAATYLGLDIREKSKGCDIGYALAASSCEEANSVDACTVTALDATTAFAVPNPNCPSQSQSVFSGLVARPVALLSWSPSLLRISDVLVSPTLSAIDACKTKQLPCDCQCRFSVQTVKLGKASTRNAIH